MRIAISGATGFLGGRLARRLVSFGAEVVAFGRDREKGAALERSGIPFHSLHFDRPQWPSGLPDADVFVHAAALSSAWGPEALFHAANVTGTETAIALARRMGVRRFIFISSPAVTFRMADCEAIAETDPLPPPVNAYARSKVRAEAIVRAAADLKPLILRPRAIYGRGETSLLPRLVRAATTGPLPLLRGGRAATQLTHVEDVIDAVLLAAQAPGSLAGRTYHVAGPEILPVRIIAEEACRRCGIDVRWRPVPWPAAWLAVGALEQVARLRPGAPEPRITRYGLGLFAFRQILDATAIRNDLGFVPTRDFAAGLAETFSEGHP